MSAIDAALSTIDRVASEGDLAPERPADLLELDALTEPVVLPDGKRIYPPRLHGEPIDELACALIDTDRPAESTFLRLIGPPGSGKIADRQMRSPTGSGETAAGTLRTVTASRSTGSSRSPAARPATSTCSATSSSPPPTTPAPCGSSTPRSCRRCARAGW